MRFVRDTDPPYDHRAAAALLTTPQAAATVFLNAWRAADWRVMYTACTRTWKAKNEEARGTVFLLDAFGAFPLVRFGELQPAEEASPPENADFRVTVEYVDGDAIRKHTRLLRLIRETAPYKPGAGPGAYWGVDPRSALRFEETK